MKAQLMIIVNHTVPDDAEPVDGEINPVDAAKSVVVEGTEVLLAQWGYMIPRTSVEAVGPEALAALDELINGAGGILAAVDGDDEVVGDDGDCTCGFCALRNMVFSEEGERFANKENVVVPSALCVFGEHAQCDSCVCPCHPPVAEVDEAVTQVV